MTAMATSGRADRDISTWQAFRHTCGAEWSRLWTVRGTWWFTAAAATVMVGIAAAAGINVSDDARGDAAWGVATMTAIPAQFALLTLALMAVTSDYATGGILPTLQWTPSRRILFLARVLVAVATATAVGVLLGVASSLTGYLTARPLLTLPFDDGIETLTTLGTVFGAGTALAVGLGFLLRNTAGVLVSVFLLMLVLPALLPQLGYAWLIDVTDMLPGTGAMFLLTGGEPSGRGITETSATVTMLAWAAGALALGWLRFAGRDADG